MKINYGPCAVCGKPIIFLGCKYCGPKCHFSVLEPADAEAEAEAEAEGPPKSQKRPVEAEPARKQRKLYL